MGRRQQQHQPLTAATLTRALKHTHAAGFSEQGKVLFPRVALIWKQLFRFRKVGWFKQFSITGWDADRAASTPEHHSVKAIESADSCFFRLTKDQHL
jgi:hypothetical protein